MTYDISSACITVVVLLCFLRLQPPGVPNTRVFSEVVVDAFAIAIVGYAISISLGKTFALKHGYKVESNQVGKSPYTHGNRQSDNYITQLIPVFF